MVLELDTRQCASEDVGPTQTISTSSGFGLSQVVLELDTKQCASEDVGLTQTISTSNGFGLSQIV